MSKTIKQTLFVLIILIPFLAGCSLNTPYSSSVRGEDDRTTDTWSYSFVEREEKLDFLSKYITIFSEIQGAEYHIVYHDNSGGLIPGPSDWDIRVALKVAPEDIAKWTDGMKKLVRDQIDLDLWDELKTEQFTWGIPEWIEYWKRPEANVYLVVYPESGLILKIASTTYKPKPPDITYENEVAGFDKYKVFAAEILNYDVTAIPYIVTRQVETASLLPDSTSIIILYEVYINGWPLPGTWVTVIVTDENILCEVLLRISRYTEFSVADVDGDSYAEILVHHWTDGCGGAGSHETAVYKLDERGLQKLFHYPNYDDEGSRSGFNTGFTLTLADSWLHTVENKYTGYSISFVRKIMCENPFFDENGDIRTHVVEQKIDNWLGIDPFFHIFSPVDVDGDGIFEIMTAQYTYLWGRADSVGTAYTILKWNTADIRMNVVKAGFWPYEDDYDTDDYLQRWRNYKQLCLYHG